MHHHPYPVSTPLVDACMLKKADHFLEKIKQQDEIKLIICGHVHGDYKIHYGTQIIESCPATSFQWEKGTSLLKTESKKGFKRFSFYEDTYQSSVVFI
jgi:Icc protein